LVGSTLLCSVVADAVGFAHTIGILGSLGSSSNKLGNGADRGSHSRFGQNRNIFGLNSNRGGNSNCSLAADGPGDLLVDSPAGLCGHSVAFLHRGCLFYISGDLIACLDRFVNTIGLRDFAAECVAFGAWDQAADVVCEGLGDGPAHWLGHIHTDWLCEALGNINTDRLGLALGPWHFNTVGNCVTLGDRHTVGNGHTLGDRHTVGN